MELPNNYQPRKEQPNMNIGLTNAELGKVVTRFPPEPSGYLHIGHAKAALLNEYFAREYNGKFILRLDDTNPNKEKFEESIKEDLSLLGINPDVISHTSNHFEELYQYAIKIIKKGLAYVDDTDVNTMRKQRMDGIASKCRDLSIEENLQRFDEMFKGTEFENYDIHYSQKNNRDRWKIYPTYDFACPIVDSVEGVTHALRTNEYRDRNAQYDWILNALDLRKVYIWDFSRLNFVYTLLSKRKLAWFVEKGLVSGWDDPRFPTVRGILRRGMTVEALKKYILIQGASQNTVLLEWDKLWAINKSVIDPVSPRHTTILEKDLVKVNIINGPEIIYSKDLPKHKKNLDVGTKKTWYSSKILIDQEDAKTFDIDEEITLMDWGNAFVKAIHKSTSNQEVVSGLELQLHLEGDFKKTKKKITWLADIPEVTKVVLVDYDYLITKRKLEENDELQDYVTEKSEFLTDALADSNVRELKKGNIIQFERKGYYIMDNDIDKIPRFISIPDGKASSMASKAGKNENTSDDSVISNVKMYRVSDIYVLMSQKETLDLEQKQENIKQTNREIIYQLYLHPPPNVVSQIFHDTLKVKSLIPPPVAPVKITTSSFSPNELVEFITNFVHSMGEMTIGSRFSMSVKKFREFFTTLLYLTNLSTATVIISMKYFQRYLSSGATIDFGLDQTYLIALILADKFHNDYNYTNKTWSEITDIPFNEINKMELKFLNSLNFRVYINDRSLPPNLDKPKYHMKLDLQGII
ncbi:2024_t:CDS:10 [Diversispora eburnea]|uniref:glutamate--tRNA ligase n=1 Tax=Diversispora eburnea TaxID=1213867 RepID=A0A9N8ZLI5_9GLOM|nr:2024_t:CDS:10 [Diversispora eburnea]